MRTPFIRRGGSTKPASAASSVRAGSAQRRHVERRDRLGGEPGDGRLEVGQCSGVDDDLLHVGDVGVGEIGAADPGRARRAGPGVAAARARASSGVGLPSRRSPPTGLPVVCSSPNAPITSSRIWNASPSGRPNALSAGASSSKRSGAASAAPRCSGRSMVYLPDLYRQMRSACATSRTPRTEPRMSSTWPTLSSIRSSFQIRQAVALAPAMS